MSDHISGPRALAEPIADITDFYAYPSPDRPDRLVLVMNTRPFAPPDQCFSDGLVYRFRGRPLEASDGGPGLFDLGGPEWVVDLTFEEPASGGERQDGVCRLPDGSEVSFVVGDSTGGHHDAVRIFAGTRWDPFFMDAPAMLTTLATGELSFTRPGAIFMDGKNVLSIVAEVDANLLGAGLVGVVAETLTRGRLNVRIERVGRPEVKNMMLSAKEYDQLNRDIELRDLYNMEDAFHLADGYLTAYRARLDANLAFWDNLDGTADWTIDDGHHPLTDLILADYLVVDVDKPYRESGSFLEIERALMRGERHDSCGGRTLNDDVMDTLFTLLVNAGSGPRVSDGVDAASRPASTTFPYLSEANPDPPQPPPHH